MNSIAFPRTMPSLILWIVVTALIAAILDAIGAIVVFSVKPEPLFRFIASGAFGKEAFSGGAAMIAYGVAFHFIIALSWTIVFFLVYRSTTLHRMNLLISAVAFGVIIWIVMNLIVLRFSEIPGGPMEFRSALTGTAILVVAVALPIVFSARQFYRK